MGQESSTLVDENVRPQRLQKRDIASVAEYIKSGRAKRIVVMTGAGISTAAGIPDFRSPDTGLYANLARLNLPYAEAVFDISYFRNNPLPFYTLAQELYPGRYRPTITHLFLKLLHDKGLLDLLFTQNIDCLEREAGVPDRKIIEAHGSFARQSCIECKRSFPKELMVQAIDKKEVPRCLNKDCNGLVKPEIVFFGEALPQAFADNRLRPAMADLCIVLGTSLTVQPFASLPTFCKEGTPRVLINLERVGGLGSRPDDVLILGDCDAGIRKLATFLGWRDELEALWEKTNPEESRSEAPKSPEEKKATLEDEIDKLTGEVDQSLKIAEDHGTNVRNELGAKNQTESSEQIDSQSTTTEQPAHLPNTGEARLESERNLRHVFPHI